MSDFNLQENTGSFVIKGVIEGKDNPAKNNGYTTGVQSKGKNFGKSYRSIKFKVKTSNSNIIPVELFGAEKDIVIFYNKETKTTKKVAWGSKGITPPVGFELIIPEFDLVEKIHNEFHDGDVVRIIGKFRFSEYTNKQGNTSNQVNFTISQIHKSDDQIDFDSKDYKEINSFTHDFIVSEVEDDYEGNRLIVNALVIGYGDKITPAIFEVDKKTSSDRFVAKMKTFKLGDYLKAQGTIKFCSIYEEIDDEFGKSTISHFTKSLQINNIDRDSVELGKYKESDLVKIDEEEIDWGTSNANLPF